MRAPVLGYKEAMAVVPVCWVPGPAPRVALAPEAVVAQRAAAGFAVKGLDEVRVIFACMEKERSGREGTIMVRVGREAGGEQKERALREGGEEKITDRAIASNPPPPPTRPLHLRISTDFGSSKFWSVVPFNVCHDVQCGHEYGHG